MWVKKIGYLALLGGLVSGASAWAGYLTNFNDPNTQTFVDAVKNKSVHIIQFGDSHTAADVMTGAVRDQLQSQLGSGGMGWAMPMYFSGQRLERFGYDNTGWKPVSSRQERYDNYTLGGLNAKPQYRGATLTIKAKRAELPQQILVNLRQAPSDEKFTGIDAAGQKFEFEAPIKNGTWQTVELKAQLPFTITSGQTSDSAIGGWWAKNQTGKGVVVSALGINGAELGHWDRWSNDWKNNLKSVAPQLVILAYGTNEAFNNNVDLRNYKTLLTEKIAQIRAASPNTAIMIVSAPEALKSTAGECGTRPNQLTAIQNVQYEVAQQQHTLFWNWQQAMGGTCSMKSWMNQGLARKDGVHFSEAGYQKLGKIFANDLLELLTPKGQDYSSSTPQNLKTTPSPTSLGYASICLSDNQKCTSL